MGWDDTRGATHPKYRTREHKAYRAGLVKELKRIGYLICTAKTCVMPTREIRNPNGRARDGLHAGHADNGVDYAGPQHNACNVKDGAVRGRQRQVSTDLSWLPNDRPWLRKDNHPCPTCGAVVEWASQKCCSRACATRLRHRRRIAKQPPLANWCVDCGEVIGNGKRCKPCRIENQRTIVRNTYRKRVGIPLDAPLSANGRPRSA